MSVEIGDVYTFSENIKRVARTFQNPGHVSFKIHGPLIEGACSKRCRPSHV